MGLRLQVRRRKGRIAQRWLCEMLMKDWIEAPREGDPCLQAPPHLQGEQGGEDAGNAEER